MITLNYPNNQITIKVSDSSYRYRSLMAKPQLVLKFSLPEYIEFPIGTWCDYEGERYTLNQSQNIKKNGTRNIEYTLTMGGEEDKMSIFKMRNTIDHRLKWSMCARPHEFVEEIVKNLNERMGENVWSVGTCIEHTEKTVEFNHTYIDAALQSIADAFETEWEIVNHTISLHKVEYFKDTPLPLSYGKGNGFVPGVGRTTASNEQPIKRLYIQGGERNIDRSKYGSAELLLPKGQTLDYEGRTYRTDADGYYIERIDKVSDAVKEDSLDCSETYPSRVGTVSSVEVMNAAKNFYDIIDNTIPDSLNFNDYLIKGSNMTIIFQSGMLASKEFELKYKHAERRFEIVPQEIDGVTMPNDTWKPQVGDTYAVFGCMLPDAYICDNVSKTGASWDMFREGAKYLYEHEDQKFTFTGTLQGLYAKRNWENIGGRLKVGSYIHFSDGQFAKDGIDIRITGVKDFLNTPHSPTLELSNSVSGKSVSSQLKEIDNQEVVISDTKKSIIEFTKRRFRDAKETIEMLDDSLLNYSQSVNPIMVQTMAALVGDESLQFRFIKSKEDFTPTDLPVSYDKATKQLIVSAPSYLQHMSLGINAISSNHANTDYKVWQINPYTSAVLDDAKKKYYLYAKVSQDTANIGEFMLSTKSIEMDGESGYYYLLVGILNSEMDGERSYVSLYGFTEILPGRITTDKIVSSSGDSFIDLVNNSMQLGDALSYNADGTKQLVLKFLTAENSNLGGWVFRNNRLESQNGSVYLDGISGKVCLSGVIQLATAYQGVFSDANIYHLPAITQEKTFAIGNGKEQIGKVIRFFNSSPFGGANYRISAQDFNIQYSDDGDLEISQTGEKYQAILRPQETLEMTCFETQHDENVIAGHWDISSRFSQEMFIKPTDIGRYPRTIAIGRMEFNNGAPFISGDWWNNAYIGTKLKVKRQGEGNYRISFNSKEVPSGYKVMVSGYGAIAGGYNSIKAGVYETANDYFDVWTSDDESLNDGSFDFIIFAPNWEYPLTP